MGYKTSKNWDKEEHCAVGLSMAMSLRSSGPASHLLAASLLHYQPRTITLLIRKQALTTESWENSPLLPLPCPSPRHWEADGPCRASIPVLQSRHVRSPAHCLRKHHTPTPINQQRPGAWKHLLPIAFYYL